jgi:tetratricopeptide (TPR) repeat protein
MFIMDKEQITLLNKLSAAWQNDDVACHFFLANTYLKRYPQDIYGWLAYSNALHAMGRDWEAMIALKRARRFAAPSDLPDIFNRFGHIRKERGNYKRAEYWYKRAVNHPDSKPLRSFFWEHVWLASQGRYKDAKRCHREAIRKHADTSDEAYYNLGMIYRAEEKYHQALKYFERRPVWIRST